VSVDFTKYSILAGEIDPALFGQTNLEKYDQGVALAINYFVDFKGGLLSRPGSEFVDFVKSDDKATKFVPFNFAPNVSNTYIILFGHLYIRFIQDGAYVLEADVALSGATQANPGVITSTGHSFVTGDWLKLSGVVGMTELNGVTVEVGATTTNTFEILDVFGANIDSTAYTAYVSGGVANRIYTLTSTYDEADLLILRAEQTRDLVRLTHENYESFDLVRLAHTSWTLTLTTTSNSMTKPAKPTVTASTAGTAGAAYAVTALDGKGKESLASEYNLTSASVDITTTAAASVRLTWPAVAGAKLFNVYRSLFQTSQADVSRADDVGFIGVAYGGVFIDNGIVPDFTQTPPEVKTPFYNGRILTVDITAPGTGYKNTDSVVITDGGSGTGFAGFPVIADSSGQILGVVITATGKTYTSPVVTFTTSTGSGATATATFATATGNPPAVSALFQQRQMYAASLNDPLTVWGSKNGLFGDFSFARISQDNDSLEFELNTRQAAPIRHMLPTRSGLLLFTQSSIHQLAAGSNIAVVVTPKNPLADPQSYTGASLLPPLTIDTEVLYAEGRGLALRLLEYDNSRKVFGGVNVTILSSHLIKNNTQLVSWTFASNPHKVVWGVREDGRMLGFTLEREQDVFALTQHSTQGLYKDIEQVAEGELDAVYLMIKRYVNGRWTKFIEKMASRTFDNIEDAWCVDCGLSLSHTYPAAMLTPAASTGTGISCVADASVFTSANVGDVLRVGGGKGTVATYISGTEITVDFVRDITAVIPEDVANTPLQALANAWTLDTPVTSISGFGHLEGMSLVALADGAVYTGLVVTAGTITFPEGVTNMVAGLGYTCVAQSLPTASGDVVLEGKRLRTVGVAIRTLDTRGLKVGASMTSLYDMKERTDEPYGEAIRAQTGQKYTLIDAPFSEGGQTYFVQDNPLPAAILSMVFDQELGDMEGG